MVNIGRNLHFLNAFLLGLDVELLIPNTNNVVSCTLNSCCRDAFVGGPTIVDIDFFMRSFSRLYEEEMVGTFVIVMLHAF